jgi:hypothetical protein
MAIPAVFIASSNTDIPVANELSHQLEGSAVTILWTQGYLPGKSVAESLAEVAGGSDFAIFILTGDDGSRRRNTVRDNMLFDLGYFAGRLGLSRTLVIYDPAKHLPPSDLAGTALIPVSHLNSSDLATAIAPVAAIVRKLLFDLEVPQERSGPTYYSCFISYSWTDQEFAARLHDDLQSVGIRAWLDAKEIKHGVILRDTIDKAIQAHDKVLLVLSHASVKSKCWRRGGCRQR